MIYCKSRKKAKTRIKECKKKCCTNLYYTNIKPTNIKDLFGKQTKLHIIETLLIITNL